MHVAMCARVQGMAKGAAQPAEHAEKNIAALFAHVSILQTI